MVESSPGAKLSKVSLMLSTEPRLPHRSNSKILWNFAYMEGEVLYVLAFYGNLPARVKVSTYYVNPSDTRVLGTGPALLVIL